MWRCGRHRQALQVFAIISCTLLSVYVLWGMIGGWTRECTLDYVNNGKVFQTSDCILDIIRKNYVILPKANASKLDTSKAIVNPVTQKVLSFLDNKLDGFYVEYAYAGENATSTTRELEAFNWKGIIVEHNPDLIQEIVRANRNAYIVPACLSLHKYPMVHHHHAATTEAPTRVKRDGGHNHGGDMGQPHVNIDHLTPPGVQCFPLFSVLLALEHTTVDYLSLKFDKPEAIGPLLSTIPWYALKIKMVSIEYPANSDVKSSSMPLTDSNYEMKTALDNVQIYVQRDYRAL